MKILNMHMIIKRFEDEKLGLKKIAEKPIILQK